MSSEDYISKSALLNLFKDLADEHETNGISYKALNEVILQQPTLSETEIIRKAFERVVERLEEIQIDRTEEGIVKDCNMGVCEDDYCALCLIKKIIKIVKEEGGIE